MNIQRKNSAHHFRMQSEREQTLVNDNIILLYLLLSHKLFISNFIFIHSMICKEFLFNDSKSEDISDVHKFNYVSFLAQSLSMNFQKHSLFMLTML